MAHPPIRLSPLVLLKHHTSARRVHGSVTGAPSGCIVLLKEGTVSPESYLRTTSKQPARWTSQLPSNTKNHTRVMLGWGSGLPLLHWRGGGYESTVWDLQEQISRHFHVLGFAGVPAAAES
jgi:hypothetical protein